MPLGLAFFLVASGQYLLSQRDPGRPMSWTIVALFASGAALALIEGWRTAGTAKATIAASAEGWVWLRVAIGVALLAALLRFVDLGSMPPGVWIDEALNALSAIEVARQGVPWITTTASPDPRPGLGGAYINVSALLHPLADVVGPVVWIRSTAAIFGVLAVAGVGLLGMAMFSARVGVAAMAWLAVSHYHVGLSRWGCMPIMSSVFETFSLLCFWRALQATGRRAVFYAGMAGAALAVGFYSYQTMRIVGVVLGAAGFLALLLQRRVLPAVVGAAIMCALVAPLVWQVADDPGSFASRAGDTVVFNHPDWPQQLAQAAKRSLLAFNFIGDDNPRHNLPMAPLLTFFPSVLFILGLAICTGRLAALPYGLIVLWFAAALIPGSISYEAPHGSRLLDTTPPIALAIGIAVDQMLRRSTGGAHRALGLVATGGLSAIALVAALQELEGYFVERPASAAIHDAFLPAESVAGRRLAQIGEENYVLVDPHLAGSPTAKFLRQSMGGQRAVETVRAIQVMHDFPPADAPRRPTRLLLSGGYRELGDQLIEVFSGTKCSEWFDGLGRPQVVECVVPAGAFGAASFAGWSNGLRGEYFREGASGGLEKFYENAIPMVGVNYPTDFPPTGRYAAAVWSGCLRVPVAGDYYFACGPDATAVVVGGEVVLAKNYRPAGGGEHGRRASLEAGVHPIDVVHDARDGHPHYFLELRWAQPGDHDGARWIAPRFLVPPANRECAEVRAESAAAIDLLGWVRVAGAPLPGTELQR